MAKQQVLALEEIDREFIKQIEPDWRKMLTCIQCGSCSVSCPAGQLMDYAPRELWRLMRLGMKDEVINTRTFWLCTQCDACTVRCPRGIITSGAMLNLRKWAVAEGLQLPAVLTQLREAVKTTHNILHEDNESRLIWSENLEPVPGQLRDLKRGRAEVLLFAGCVGAMYPMAYSIPQSFVQILEQAGLTYTNLAGEEWCCGYPLYGAGLEGEIAELARHNVEQARELEPKYLVATCPSCYHTWSHIYPQYITDGLGFEVIHSSELLARLAAEGRIKLNELDWVVTYHDPCDLGRKSGVYDAPRSIIEAIPRMTFREMRNNRENALCCGGGGDVAMWEAEVTEDIAERRIEQAKATGATAIISACQQCKRTLLQAARKTKTRMRVLDVTELVWQAMEKGEIIG
ncbi:MAG TPA: (Fe-S)-binding protein [Anaerolineae bacterium]|nr:(Fe-S)-binding protein [Anaerolineae bacterium]